MKYIPTGIAIWDMDIGGIPVESISVLITEDELNGVRICEMFLRSMPKVMLVDARGNLVNLIYPAIKVGAISTEQVVDINLFDGGHFWDRYNRYAEKVKLLKLNGGVDLIIVNGLQEFFNYFKINEEKEMIDFTDKTILGVLYKHPLMDIEKEFASSMDLYARRIMKIDSLDVRIQTVKMTILKDEDGFVEKEFTFYVESNKMWKH